VEERERERERERKREGYSPLWGRRAHRIAIYDFSGASTDVGVLNKTHPFLCSLSRILPISRRPTPCDPSGSLFLSLSLFLPLPLFFSLSLSLSLSLSVLLCGFYNQIRVDISGADTTRSLRVSVRRGGLLSGIYVLRLMWAVGGDDKRKHPSEGPCAPTVEPQSAGRLCKQAYRSRAFYCVRSFIRLFVRTPLERS